MKQHKALLISADYIRPLPPPVSPTVEVVSSELLPDCVKYCGVEYRVAKADPIDGGWRYHLLPIDWAAYHWDEAEG